MRRLVLFASMIGAFLRSLAFAEALPVATTETSPTAASIYDIPVQPREADKSTSPTLAPYRGEVMLIVNVASKCGFTKQYAGLEKLHEQYKGKGLHVLGFPCNDFNNQEPGTEEEIINFCKLNYGVTFPIYAKISIKGDPPSPLYRYLLANVPDGKESVRWNFEKFLVGRDGKVVQRFRSTTKPDDKDLIAAIEAELAKPAPAR